MLLGSGSESGIDYIDLCSKASYDAFSVLDKSLYPEEYTFAQNMYTKLLLVCCCLCLIDKGVFTESDKICGELHRYWKEESSFSFTPWSYRVYKTYKEYKQYKLEDRDAIDADRNINGHIVGEFILNNYLYDEHYDTLKKELWDKIENTIDYLIISIGGKSGGNANNNISVEVEHVKFNFLDWCSAKKHCAEKKNCDENDASKYLIDWWGVDYENIKAIPVYNKEICYEYVVVTLTKADDSITICLQPAIYSNSSIEWPSVEVCSENMEMLRIVDTDNVACFNSDYNEFTLETALKFYDKTVDCDEYLSLKKEIYIAIEKEIKQYLSDEFLDKEFRLAEYWGEPIPINEIIKLTEKELEEREAILNELKKGQSKDQTYLREIATNRPNVEQLIADWRNLRPNMVNHYYKLGVLEEFATVCLIRRDKHLNAMLKAGMDEADARIEASSYLFLWNEDDDETDEESMTEDEKFEQMITEHPEYRLFDL